MQPAATATPERIDGGGRLCNRKVCRAPITRNKGESMRDWLKRRYCCRLCASVCSPMKAMMREEVVEE